MVDAVKPDESNAGAAAHIPTAQPGAATAEPSAAAASPVQTDLPLASNAEPAIAEAAKPAEAGAEAPRLDKTLLEKFDADKAAEATAAEAAKKAAKPADAKDAKAADKPVDGKPADAKPAEKKADEAVKPAEDKPAEPAKPEAVAYEYKLPDTLKMDDALKGKVHTALDAFRADPAKNVQGLFDLHAQTMADFAQATRQAQYDTFNKTKADWEKQVMADPELGGAGHLTAMGAVARTRDLLISSAKPGTPRYNAEKAEFDQFLAVTGAGSHPAFMRMLHNGARYLDEPQASQSAITDIKPPKGNGKPPGSRLYDHPSSQKAARS